MPYLAKQDFSIRKTKISKCILEEKFSGLLKFLVLFFGIVFFVFIETQKLFAQAIPVELIKTADGHWQLIRDGQPYYIKGAGGDGPKDLLAKAGANTFRTWGIGPDFGEQLDQAQQLGINVERVKLTLLIVATLITAAAVSFCGIIGFVGIIIPHAVRLIWGPDHRFLLPLATLSGWQTRHDASTSFLGSPAGLRGSSKRRICG